jgi:hypothetical protein
LRDSDEQWIRKIHLFDAEHFLIICCTYAQAKAFAQAQCIEMDLSFKMVQGSTNLFSLASWNEDTKRKLHMCQAYAKQILIYSGINVYCYAFLNLETREAYAGMFIELFQILEDVGRSPIRFPHIHGGEKGIRTITVDMCKKQGPGIMCTCKDYAMHMLIIYRIWRLPAYT